MKEIDLQHVRDILNHPIVATIKMLEQLPWPRHPTRVPEYVGGRYERMDGEGHPKGLTREQMSPQARMMGIVANFKKNGHIDPTCSMFSSSRASIGDMPSSCLIRRRSMRWMRRR